MITGPYVATLAPRNRADSPSGGRRDGTSTPPPSGVPSHVSRPSRRPARPARACFLRLVGTPCCGPTREAAPLSGILVGDCTVESFIEPERGGGQINEVTRAFMSRRTVNPRTTLAFYATIVITLVVGTVTACGVILSSPELYYLVPWILVVGTVSSLATVGGVFYINISKPQNLMLGQITGDEYARIERVTPLGDSLRGERPVVVHVPDNDVREPKAPVASESIGDYPATPPESRFGDVV